MNSQTSILSIAILSAGLSACGGSSSSSSSTNEVLPSLANLNIECATVEKAIDNADVGTLQLSIVDSYFSGSDFVHSSSEIVS